MFDKHREGNYTLISTIDPENWWSSCTLIGRPALSARRWREREPVGFICHSLPVRQTFPYLTPTFTLKISFPFFVLLIRIFKDSFLTRPQWMWQTDWCMDWRLQQSKDLLRAGSQVSSMADTLQQQRGRWEKKKITEHIVFKRNKISQDRQRGGDRWWSPAWKNIHFIF